jgi:hypothetical protein
MLAMRVSLVARYASHPVIEFGRGRRRAQRARLGLGRTQVVYHRPRRSPGPLPSIRVLRPQTSRFRFPSVGRVVRVVARRHVPPFGLSRARRA